MIEKIKPFWENIDVFGVDHKLTTEDGELTAKGVIVVGIAMSVLAVAILYLRYLRWGVWL
jgi:hypothetical protein